MSSKTIYFVSFNIIDRDDNGNIVIKHTGHGLVKFKEGLDLIGSVMDIIKQEKDLDINPDNVHIIAFNSI